MPSIYMCPADRARTSPVSWHSFDCKVTYKSEHVVCDATVEAYKGETPDDLNGRAFGKGSCVEFHTHDILLAQEWESSWNEITLRASFSAADMFDQPMSDALQEVELGYRIVETAYGRKADRYYYPLLRVPVFPYGVLKDAGICTRAFLGEEVDKTKNVKGRYWLTYGALQIPVLNASKPGSTFGSAVSPPVLSDPLLPTLGIAHVVLTVEDFSLYATEEVPFVIPLLKTLGEIAGVAAFFTWTMFRCRGVGGISGDDEGSGSRVLVYSQVNADDEEDGQIDSDLDSESRQHLMSRVA